MQAQSWQCQEQARSCAHQGTSWEGDGVTFPAHPGQPGEL